MQIPVNKNIDHYKDDFFKGMTMRQAIFCIATVVTGAAAFLFFYMYLKLPVMAAIYLMLPIAFPVAAAGFLQIGGKSPGEYFKLRARTKKTPLYLFSPILLADMDSLPDLEKGQTEQRVKKKEIYLRQEEEV